MNSKARLLILLSTNAVRVLRDLGFDARNIEAMPNCPFLSVFDIPTMQLAALFLLYTEARIIARLPLECQQELAA